MESPPAFPSYVPRTASMFNLRSEPCRVTEETGIFIEAALIDTLQACGPASLVVLRDLQNQAELLDAHVESALPDARDVLRLRVQECARGKA